MSELLLISDDVPRTERLLRYIGSYGACRIHNLYDEAAGLISPEIIISDVADLTSAAIQRLRRVLADLRGAGVPYLFLAHGNSARAEAHSRVLGADETIDSAAANHRLLARMRELRRPPGSSTLIAEGLAGEAKAFFQKVFVSDTVLQPDLVENGTTLVVEAIGNCGISSWIEKVRCFDDLTHQHCLLVAGLAAAFGSSLGLAQADQHRLTKAALLHDVGKTKIPAEILNKPGKLDLAEMVLMRTHAAEGHAMLVGQGFEEAMLTVVRSHHEMLDGSGYPDGLKSNHIPDLVRLVTICDIFSALIERRPYKAPVSGKAALAVVESMTGKLDGDLVRMFRPVASAFDPPIPAASQQKFISLK